jgi:ABC-type multidrug transport system ATPase subunit
LTLLEASKIKVDREGREILAVGHLDVERGEILAVIGPNGAGKSTLIQVLGLLGQFEGQITLDGAVVRDRLAARRRMAVRTGWSGSVSEHWPAGRHARCPAARRSALRWPEPLL